MTRWQYEGFTKVKSGEGRNARYIEMWEYKCPKCGHTVRIPAHIKPPSICNGCEVNHEQN